MSSLQKQWLQIPLSYFKWRFFYFLASPTKYKPLLHFSAKPGPLSPIKLNWLLHKIVLASSLFPTHNLNSSHFLPYLASTALLRCVIVYIYLWCVHMQVFTLSHPESEAPKEIKHIFSFSNNPQSPQCHAGPTEGNPSTWCNWLEPPFPPHFP